jgi:hypothetical protein
MFWKFMVVLEGFGVACVVSVVPSKKDGTVEK